MEDIKLRADRRQILDSVYREPKGVVLDKLIDFVKAYSLPNESEEKK